MIAVVRVQVARGAEPLFSSLTTSGRPLVSTTQGDSCCCWWPPSWQYVLISVDVHLLKEQSCQRKEKRKEMEGRIPLPWLLGAVAPWLLGRINAPWAIPWWRPYNLDSFSDGCMTDGQCQRTPSYLHTVPFNIYNFTSAYTLVRQHFC